MLIKHLGATAALLTACTAVPFPKEDVPGAEGPSVTPKRPSIGIYLGNSTEVFRDEATYGAILLEDVFELSFQYVKEQGPWSHISLELDKDVKNTAQRCMIFNEDDDLILVVVKDKTENTVPKGIWKLAKPSLVMRVACDSKYGSTPGVTKFNRTTAATVTFSDEKGDKKMRRTFDRFLESSPASIPLRGAKSVGPWTQVEVKVEDAVKGLKENVICVAEDKDGKTIEVSRGAETENVFWDDGKGPWKLNKQAEVHRVTCSPEDYVPQSTYRYREPVQEFSMELR